MLGINPITVDGIHPRMMQGENKYYKLKFMSACLLYIIDMCKYSFYGLTYMQLLQQFLACIVHCGGYTTLSDVVK